MTSLHDVTDKIKLLAKSIFIATAAFFVIFLLYKIGIAVKEYFYPTPPTPPTVSFGKLPPLDFPQNLFEGKKFTYTLDTLTGQLPNFPDRATIHKIIQATPNLLALERAQKNVAQVGFTGKPIRISDIEYVWNEQTAPSRKLQMDVLSFNLVVSSDYLNDQNILAAKNLLDEQQAKNIVQTFLSSLKNTPKDIDTEKTKTSLLTITNNSLLPATSLSNTKIIRVDYFQKEINKLSIYYASYPLSSLHFLVGSTQNGLSVVAANFPHQAVDENSSATYPIKTAEDAFVLLKEGKGYIALSPANGGNINIKNVVLGYYLGDTPQKFLLPIIIFEGNNFYAYIPAVKDEWIQE